MRLFGRLYTPFDRGLAVVTVEDGVIAGIESAAEKPADGASAVRSVPGARR